MSDLSSMPSQPPQDINRLPAWVARLWFWLRAYLAQQTQQISSQYAEFASCSLGSAQASSLEVVQLIADELLATDTTTDRLIVGDYDAGNYAEISATGLRLYGTATSTLDELGFLITQRIESPASRIVADHAEGELEYKDTCTLDDYVSMPIQINHNWDGTTPIGLHLHWPQASANLPNWLIQYRWRRNGQAKATSWTSKKYDSHVYTYTSGTLEQITSFGTITPPADVGLSSFLQVRLLRDVANTSTLFAGADPLTGSAKALGYDAHKVVDGFGSNTEYEK